MILRRLTTAFRKQDWFTVMVEILIVVLGVFLGIQVANWNDARIDQGRAQAYLERIGLDLDADLATLADRKDFWRQVSRYGEAGLRYAASGSADDTSHWAVLLAYFQAREPLNKSARSAFQSEKPQIVRAVASDSSRRYGRVTSRARCGFSGETLSGRAFAGHPARFDSLIWNNQTTLVEATPGDPAKTPSRPCRLVQRFPGQVAEFITTQATYDDLRSAGDLELITNLDIRNELARYYNFGAAATVVERPAYREHVRGIIPMEIQAYFWDSCYESNATGFQQMFD
ncbi:MAG: hypothetical protein RQ729_12895 [Wenzhouxiangellaceae bacterium]|nr:hypothetical protein [Wenzhouxiangellaceae bacterium]